MWTNSLYPRYFCFLHSDLGRSPAPGPSVGMVKSEKKTCITSALTLQVQPNLITWMPHFAKKQNKTANILGWNCKPYVCMTHKQFPKDAWEDNYALNLMAYSTFPAFFLVCSSWLDEFGIEWDSFGHHVLLLRSAASKMCQRGNVWGLYALGDISTPPSLRIHLNKDMWLRIFIKMRLTQ